MAEELDSCKNSNSRGFEPQGNEPVFLAKMRFFNFFNRCIYRKTLLVLMLRNAQNKFAHTVSPIIIGEMEMWWCPDYLFTVAESRGGMN